MALQQRDVTGLLADWNKGDEAARNELITLTYDELRRLAARHMAREREGHSLQAADLVNEAWLRLVDQRQAQWQNRAHFFAFASRAMRHVLVDHARHRNYAKRGGGQRPGSMDEALRACNQRTPAVVALDDALTSLATIDLRKSQIVELRYFGGLTVEEISKVLKISPITVRRDWKFARAWLFRAMTESANAESHL